MLTESRTSTTARRRSVSSVAMTSGCGCSRTCRTTATRFSPRPIGRFSENPLWLDLKPAKIFRLAFRDRGNLIDSREHALFRKLAARDSD